MYRRGENLLYLLQKFALAPGVNTLFVTLFPHNTDQKEGTGLLHRWALGDYFASSRILRNGIRMSFCSINTIKLTECVTIILRLAGTFPMEHLHCETLILRMRQALSLWNTIIVEH